MSKRKRQVDQRLNELFSIADQPEAAETQPAAPAVEPETQPTRAARSIGPAATAPADLPHLTAAIEQLPLPAYVKDREHTWVAVNAAFAQLLGHAPEALLGHTDKEQADDAWQLDDRVLDSGREEASEETTPLPDGTIRTRRIRRTLLGTETRYVMGIVEELVAPAPGTHPHMPESDETFHAAMDAIPSPVIISRISDDVILYANQTFSAFTAVPLDRLTGQCTAQFFADLQEQERVVQGVRQQGELRGTEVRMRRADGSIFWVSMSVRRLKFNGEACVITTLEDISARKQVQEELVKFKLGIDRAYYSVMITSVDGTILYVNPAFTKIYGYTADEAMGRKPSLLKSGHVNPDQYTRFWTKLLAGETVIGEIVNKTKDGRLIPVETNNSPILDESGQIIGFVSMQSDISARKQAEEDLVTRNRQLATFNRVGQELAQLVTAQEVVEHVFAAMGEVIDNRNLYIALYDDRKQEISFPIYTMDGERRAVASRPFGNGMTEHVLRTKKTLWIPREVQEFAASIGVANIGRPSQCYLGVPLLSGDKALGVIAVQDYDREYVYSTTDVELLSAIAAQTAAALETVRLYAAESRRAVQLQTAAEISTAAGTVLNVDELLPFVVNLIQQRFSLYYVGLFLLDEAQQSAMLRAGTGEAGQRMLEHQHQLSLDDRSMIGWSIQHRVPRIALDVGEDAVRFNNPDLPDTRSELALPLVSRDQVLGAMTVQSKEAAAFTEQDIAILQTMSDQVATAIANAQLFEQVGQARQQAEARLRETQFLQSVGQAVSSSLELSNVMDMVMDTLQGELGFTHNALYLVDKQAGMVSTQRASGTAAQLQGLTRSIEQLQNDILLDILRKGQLEVIDGWDDRLDREIYEAQGHAALVRAFVPLRLRGESIGLLEVGYRRADRARITPEEVRLLSGLADQIAIAVENARLFRVSQQRITELAVVNEISRTLTATQDVQQLFATIHQQVGRLYDAANFYIATYDGGEEWLLDYQFEHGQLLPSTRHKLGGGFTSYILQTRQPILIRSLQENFAFHDQQNLPTIGETAKSWMGVPLVVGGSIIGVMGIQSYEQEGLYADHDVALFSTIGTQAASAIQNARLFQQARLRAVELAALNELSQTLAAQLSVSQVVHEVWQGVSRLLDTTNFYIALYDQEREEVSFPINASESVLDKEIEIMPADQGLTGYIIRTRQPLLITEDTGRHVKELGLENVGGTSQSYLGVPLILGEQVLGVMAIQSYSRTRLYNEHDQDLMAAIAGQAAIALQNARLFEQTQKQARETTAINEILQAVSQRQDLDQILETAYRHIHELVPSDACIVAMYDASINRLWYPLIYDNDQRFPVRDGDIASGTNISRVITGGEPLLVHRTSQELERIGKGAPTAVGNVDRSSASLLYVPLISEQKVIGALSVQSYQLNAYTSEHSSLLKRIANQLGVAVQNIRLFEQIQQNAGQLAALNALGQAVSQQIEIEQVLDVAYQQLQPLVPVDAFFAALYDRESNTTALPVIYDEGKRYSDSPGPFNPNSNTGKVIQTGEPMLKLLSAEELAAVTEVQGAVGNVTRPSASLLYVPLKVGAQTIGTLSIQSYQIGAYNDDTVQLMGNVANQVAIAIQNARLFGEAQQRGAELATLNQIISSAAQTLEMSTLLDTVLKQTLEVFGFDGGLITVYNESRQKLERIVRTGLPGQIPDDPAEGLENSLCAYVFNSREPLVIEDFRQGSPIDVSGEIEAGYYSYIGVPLEARGHMLGTWCGFRKSAGPFGKNTLALLQAVSRQLSFTIENAHLFDEARTRAHREQTLREITSRVRNSTDPDAIVRAAVRELGIALGRQTFIRLGDAEKLRQPPESNRDEVPASGNGHQTGLEGGQ